MSVNSQNERAALSMAAAVAHAIRDLGEVPSGHLYARLMGHGAPAALPAVRRRVSRGAGAVKIDVPSRGYEGVTDVTINGKVVLVPMRIDGKEFVVAVCPAQFCADAANPTLVDLLGAARAVVQAMEDAT